MVSHWQLPLPAADYTHNRVVVYFYSDRWIPIACFHLNEAIALYRKGAQLGKEILVFPPGLNLETKNIFSKELSCSPAELVSKLS